MNSENKEIQNYLYQEYERHFKSLVQECKTAKVKLFVLYIPQKASRPEDKYHKVTLEYRRFFSTLAKKYKVEYFDVIKEFQEYPVQTITLSPENGHLSRFGNQILVQKIKPYIAKYNEYKSPTTYSDKPAQLGDFKPGENEIWTINPEMPYRVIINRQGFRLKYELPFPKIKQRILVLGDSFTFGPYLDNHDTYPSLLDKFYQKKEVINAGLSGTTIFQQAEFFKERAKYSEPDIVILQVLDNDITDLFSYNKTLYDRKGRIHKPSEAAKKFFKRLRANSKPY